MEFYFTIARSDLRQYMPDVPALFPASSYFVGGKLKIPKIPSHVVTRAGDCGGFVFAQKGGGYGFSIRELADWYAAIGVTWGAMLDYPCEREVCTSTRERQRLTSLRIHQIWYGYRTEPFIWVPTIQGFTADEYRLHARELAPVITDMQQFYGEGFRVGIGSLCRRTRVSEIQEIVATVGRELPGVPLHLWGVKLTLFKNRTALHPQIISADSAAWNGAFGRDLDTQRTERRALGLTKGRYFYEIALPRYQAKIEKALNAPKQQFWGW